MILQGDVREQTATLADESVHCVMTSPPYWGLRDYKLPPQVWDDPGECEHEWGDIQGQTTTQWAEGVGQKGDTLNNAEKRAEKRISQKPIQGQFCSKCNAWRGSLGLEPTPELYLQHMVEIFREIRRGLRTDGVVFLNMGDSYNAHPGQRKTTDKAGPKQVSDKGSIETASRYTPGLKPKDLCMIPARLALALQADGWWLRSDIIWAKPNPMPESVTDRPTRSHEYIFLLTKSARYYYDAEAVREAGNFEPHSPDWTSPVLDRNDRQPENEANQRSWGHPGGRNMRSVWNIATQPFLEAHFATFPEKLVQRCIMAGTSERGCCPDCGAPWARVVEKEFTPQEDVSLERGIKGAVDQKPMDESNQWDGIPRGSNKIKTLNWRPTCECGKEPVPCVVLDPFLGSGTVGKVAQVLGRDWIGIELNPDYCEMARKRTIHRQEVLGLGYSGNLPE